MCALVNYLMLYVYQTIYCEWASGYRLSKYIYVSTGRIAVLVIWGSVLYAGNLPVRTYPNEVLFYMDSFLLSRVQNKTYLATSIWLSDHFKALCCYYTMLGINRYGANPFGRYLLPCVLHCVHSFYLMRYYIDSALSICFVIITVCCCFFRMFVDALDAQMYDKHHRTVCCCFFQNVCWCTGCTNVWQTPSNWVLHLESPQGEPSPVSLL